MRKQLLTSCEYQTLTIVSATIGEYGTVSEETMNKVTSVLYFMDFDAVNTMA